MTAVFPGVSNVKTSRTNSGSQRSRLARHVKGLGEFDKAAWNALDEKLNEDQELAPDTIKNVFQNLPHPKGDEHAIDSWVKDLAGKRKHSQAHARSKRSSEDAKALELDTKNDDFQRQETQSHLPKHSPTEKATLPQAIRPAQNDEDSETETEDEDCLDIPPTRSQEHALSTTERSDDPEERHNPEITKSNETSSRARASGDVTAKGQRSSQYDLDEETEGPASSPPIRNSQMKQETHDAESEAEPEKPIRKGGLGRFGGAKPKNEPQSSETEAAKPKSTLGKFGGKKMRPQVTPEPTNSVPTSKPTSTLGRFGGKAKTASASQSSGERKGVSPAGNETAKTGAPPSRKLAPEVEQAPEREMTEQEKQAQADEKREKLKRELEQKAKAPAKKKRKF